MKIILFKIAFKIFDYLYIIFDTIVDYIIARPRGYFYLRYVRNKCKGKGE